MGSFVARTPTETRVVTVAPPACLKAQGRPKQLNDIEHADCIDFHDAARGRAYEWEIQSPMPRGNVSPDEPAATLRTLEMAADESERRTSIAGTFPPMSVSDA